MKQLGSQVGILIVLLLCALGMSPMSAEIQGFGKTVYDQHCLRCHGSNGQGDGPDAAALTIKPANFHSSESRSKSDDELISKVTWGGVYSPMHGWGTRLTRRDIYSVVWYIRHLAPYESSGP
jgi:mono/diheme cytochrome c family protein